MTLKKLKSRQVQTIVRAYQRGATPSALAERYGLTWPTVHYHLSRAGVYVSSRRHRYTSAEDDVIVLAVHSLSSRLRLDPLRVAWRIHTLVRSGKIH